MGTRDNEGFSDVVDACPSWIALMGMNWLAPWFASAAHELPAAWKTGQFNSWKRSFQIMKPKGFNSWRKASIHYSREKPFPKQKHLWQTMFRYHKCFFLKLRHEAFAKTDGLFSVLYQFIPFLVKEILCFSTFTSLMRTSITSPVLNISDGCLILSFGFCRLKSFANLFTVIDR